jgi:hypothetical protein
MWILKFGGRFVNALSMRATGQCSSPDSLQPLPQLWLAQPSDGFQVVCLREKVEQIQRHHFVA